MQYPQITVFLLNKQLRLSISAQQHLVYPIAIGKSATPTPKGTWSIQNKKILADAGPFGTHWLGLNNPGYGIHGTNQPQLIGTAVSSGCIRMHNHDIKDLFNRVHLGTSVIITD